MTPEFGTARTAIVTGGARRIGAALVRALHADGWHVLLHCHASADAGADLAAELAGDDGRVTVVVADLAAPDVAMRVFAALDGMPPVGLLVNNASIFRYDTLDGFDVAAWDAHQATNVRGPALLIQAFAAAVPAEAGGLIVNLLDAKLAQPNPDYFTYTVSKMGLAGLTELAARALAARRIRVCGIAPSITLVSGKQTRDDFDAVHRMNALERGIVVDDIVAALRYLIRTPVLTGQTITLDAGQRFLALPRDVQYMDAS